MKSVEAKYISSVEEVEVEERPSLNISRVIIENNRGVVEDEQIIFDDPQKNKARSLAEILRIENPEASIYVA